MAAQFFQSIGNTLEDAFDPNKNGVAKAFDPKQNGVANVVTTVVPSIGSDIQKKLDSSTDWMLAESKKQALAYLAKTQKALDPTKNGVGSTLTDAFSKKNMTDFGNGFLDGFLGTTGLSSLSSLFGGSGDDSSGGGGSSGSSTTVLLLLGGGIVLTLILLK